MRFWGLGNSGVVCGKLSVYTPDGTRSGFRGVGAVGGAPDLLDIYPRYSMIQLPDEISAGYFE